MITINRNAALSGATSVPNAFISEYLRDAPEDHVKVYLYALMQAQYPALPTEDIASALSITENRLMEALDYWSKIGLMRVISSDGLYIELLPVTAQRSPSFGENKYDDLLTALREVMGMRVFTSLELRTVYDWIEVFGLSPEVVVKLVSYCMELRGRQVSVKYMDSVAKSWADMHLYTVPELDEHLNQQTEYAGHVREIKKRWRLSRNITEDELLLYRKWRSEWGLSHEVIMEACKDAVHASSPSFAYLDSVLSAYRERGTCDMEAIDAFKKQRMLSDDLARRMFEKAGLKRRPTLPQRDRVDTWLNDWRLPEEALLLLAERASAAAKPFEYMTRIAASWNERDIRNIDSAKRDLDAPHEDRQAKKYSPKMSRSGRKYSAEDLRRMGVDISSSPTANDDNKG